MTNQTPRISVIIPSFNKARYIGETLGSIFTQKYPKVEVIIQDGESIDGTLDVIKKFAQKYPKSIRWESKKDKGQLDAINKGMEKASGEILAYINADDIYTHGAFGEVARLYSADPEAYWFAGRGRVLNSSGEEIAKAVTWYKNLFLSINHKSLILILNYLMQPSVFITRSAWQKFGPFTGNKNFVTEYDLWSKIAKHGMPMVSDKYFSGFRIEPSTITKTNTRKLLAEDEKIVRKYTSNSIILLLHALHNYGRRLIGGVI